jgi:Molybdopterin oxidoreductase
VPEAKLYVRTRQIPLPSVTTDRVLRRADGDASNVRAVRLQAAVIASRALRLMTARVLPPARYWADGNPFSPSGPGPVAPGLAPSSTSGGGRRPLAMPDIVLPATTSLERNDLGGSPRDRFVIAMHKAIEPVGNARNDFDIFRDLSRRLGCGTSFAGRRTRPFDAPYLPK